MYAELLSNIRQISVIVALKAPCDPATKVTISADGRVFILHLGEEKFTLNLPRQVAPNALFQKPVVGSKELSWRLPLTSQPSRSSIEDMQSIAAPWPAKALAKDTEFLCRECGVVIVKSGSIKIWKDLPSENWAEMMDFWHCHKPDVPLTGQNGPSGHTHNGDHSHREHPASSKGYGANTKFSATSHTGFVDLTTFLLSDSDCTNLQVRYTLFSLLVSHLYTFFSSSFWVSRRWLGLLRASQWPRHRYKCPRSNTLLPFLHQQKPSMPTLFFVLRVRCLARDCLVLRSVVR
jgi:hypothetical protein